MADLNAPSADRSGPYDASLAPAALLLSSTTTEGGDGVYDGTGPYDASLDQKGAVTPDPIPAATEYAHTGVTGYPKKVAEAPEEPDPIGPDPIPCTGGFCGVKDKAAAPLPSPAPSSGDATSGESTISVSGDSTSADSTTPALGDPIPANTALELCPAADFAESLVALSPLLPGAVARAGGAKRLTERYARKFGQGACPLADAAAGWPQSNRSTPLLINMAEGSTGTRFLDCILSQRMRTAHFPDTALALNQTNDTEADAAESNDLSQLPLHECTRSEGGQSCTGAFDAFDYVSDTPTAQLVSLLLDTHAKKNQAAALLSLRDPWAWVSSRNNHHGQHEKNSTLPTDDWMRVSVPCGCPWRPYPFKEPRGAMLHAYASVGCNEPTSLQHYSVAALDFLTHNVWTTCLARKR